MLTVERACRKEDVPMVVVMVIVAMVVAGRGVGRLLGAMAVVAGALSLQARALLCLHYLFYLCLHYLFYRLLCLHYLFHRHIWVHAVGKAGEHFECRARVEFDHFLSPLR